MSTRGRVLTFGIAAALVVAGVLCAVVVPDVAGEILTFVLVGAGASWALLLIFLEIGLGEEQELAREDERRRERSRRALDLRKRRRLPSRGRRGDG